MQRFTRSVLFAVVVGLAVGGLAHAQPPATESGFVQVESDRPDDLSRYGLEVELADTEALRRHFGAGKVTYVGISIWANLGSLYAARHPESVERVVAVAPIGIAVELGAPPDRVVEHDVADLAAEVEAMEADGRNVTESYTYCKLEKRVVFSQSYFDLRKMAAFEAANLCQYPNEAGDRIGPVIFESETALSKSTAVLKQERPC